MSEDPRGRNRQFDFASIEGHVRGYAEVLSKALLSVDWQQLNHVITEIDDGLAYLRLGNRRSPPFPVLEGSV